MDCLAVGGSMPFSFNSILCNARTNVAETNAMPEVNDRITLAVPDADLVAESFKSIFDTEVVDDCPDEIAAARRVTLQWGHDQLELLEPRGEGSVAKFLEGGRGGIFAGGFSLDDPGALADHIQKRGIPVYEQGPDRFLILPEDCRGTGIILSKKVEHERVGLSDRIWQVTYAAPSLDDMVEYYCGLLNMKGLHTSIYHSETFGYNGGITWFEEVKQGNPLDSVEYLEPTDDQAAVARFVKRKNSGVYMCAIQTDDIPEIRKRVESTGPGWTESPELGGYIHPARLGGMLLGLLYFDKYTRPGVA